MARAVALLSGGLDSTLAILTVIKQVEVKAIKFLTPFDIHVSEISSYSKNLFLYAKKYGYDVHLFHLDQKFIDIVKNPPHGYGKNSNPCIDCRILMLQEAKNFMNKVKADFIITGEVLGQRPMSQRKDMLYHIDKKAEVTGYVLRPLSARLLRITHPEEMGIIKRELLYDFRGRSRKPQFALAEKFGLIDYPPPAGGCLLTEPNYAYRLKDLLTNNPFPQRRDFELLKVGRHFRPSPASKIIVGRDKAENDKLESLKSEEECLLKVEGYGSPVTLISGEITDEILNIAASICAKYSDAKNLSTVKTVYLIRDKASKIYVRPAPDLLLEKYRIQLPEKRKSKKERKEKVHSKQ